MENLKTKHFVECWLMILKSYWFITYNACSLVMNHNQDFSNLSKVLLNPKEQKKKMSVCRRMYMSLVDLKNYSTTISLKFGIEYFILRFFSETTRKNAYQNWSTEHCTSHKYL